MRLRGARALALFACGLALAALACNFPGGPAASATPPPAGGAVVTIGETAGQVTTRPEGGGPETPAVVGQAVGPGTEVVTGPDGRARLDLPGGGGLLRLVSNSAVAARERLDDEAEPRSRFAMSGGQLWIVLEADGGEVVVETPGGTASTRGQMSVEYYADGGAGAPLFVVTCLVGPCAANNPFDGVSLSPGQQTEAVGQAGFTPPHGIDEERLAEWEAVVPEAALATATLTVTPTGTVTATPTATPEPSQTPTGTPLPTLAPTFTRTFIPITLTPSFTPSSTYTLTPQFTATQPGPGASITADNTNLDHGGCTILRWTATNAREVYLNGQGIAGETSREICPEQTTTYTLRVVGYDNSQVESSVTVNVADPTAGPTEESDS
jgi:hypothetical protein